MKYSKSSISLLLAIITALLASCGATSTESKETTSEITPAEVTTDPEYTNPGVNYNGATFTILDYDTDEYFWHMASYSDIHSEEDSGDPINDAQFKRNRKVEEELKIKLETYPVGGVKRSNNQAELRKLVTAGDNTVDAAFVFGSEMKSLLTDNGMLIDWNDVPGIDFSDSWWDHNAIETFSLDGKLKVLTGDISLYSTFSPNILYFSKNLADIYQLGDMYDLVRVGKWTNDKVNEYCHIAASDLNGDGKMNENDRYGLGIQLSVIPYMMNSSGAKVAVHGKDGSLELSLMTEKNIDIQSRMYKFLNEHDVVTLANDYYSKFSNPFYELQLPMFKNDQILFEYNQLTVAFELRSMEADYGILPTPKADEDQEEYLTAISLSWGTMLCIPATNDRLEMTGNIVNALGYYSQQYVTPEFIDTTVRSKSLRDDDSAEMLEIILSTRTYDIGILYNWGGITSVMCSENFVSGYASIEEKLKTEMQQTIDQFK